jgi:hypothetical protein
MSLRAVNLALKLSPSFGIRLYRGGEFGYQAPGSGHFAASFAIETAKP